MAIKFPENIMALEWEKRYAALPIEKQQALDAFDQLDSRDYQLKVMKRTRRAPKRGECFVLSPKENVYFVGQIMQDSVTNRNGTDFLSVLIYDQCFHSLEEIPAVVCADHLLIDPAIVFLGYWKRGLFMQIPCQIKTQHPMEYGFYETMFDRYVDEYENQLSARPEHLGVFGISTIYGIAAEINRELIIRPEVLD